MKKSLIIFLLALAGIAAVGWPLALVRGQNYSYSNVSTDLPISENVSGGNAGMVDGNLVLGDNPTTGNTDLTVTSGGAIIVGASGNLTISASATGAIPGALIFGTMSNVTVPAAEVNGNLSTSNFNGGVNANSTTVLFGNGTWGVAAGGGATPGGSDTDVQINTAGNLTGSANLTFANNNTLTVNGTVATGSVVAPNLTANGTANFTGATVVGLAGNVAFSNPTSKSGPAAVNGIATTVMRSDSAPAVNEGANYTWTGTHDFNAVTGLTQIVVGAANSTNNQQISYENTSADWILGELSSGSFELTSNVAGSSLWQMLAAGNIGFNIAPVAGYLESFAGPVYDNGNLMVGGNLVVNGTATFGGNVSFQPFGVTGLSTILESYVPPTNTTTPANYTGTWSLVGVRQALDPAPPQGVCEDEDFLNGPVYPNIGLTNLTLTNGTWTTGAGWGNGTFFAGGNEEDFVSAQTYTIPFFQDSANVSAVATGAGVGFFTGFYVGNVGNLTAPRFGTYYDAYNGTISLYCNLSTAHTSDVFFNPSTGYPMANTSVAAGGYACNLTTAAQIYAMNSGWAISAWLKPAGGKAQPISNTPGGAGVELKYWGAFDAQTPANLAKIHPIRAAIVPSTASGNIVVTHLQDGYAGGVGVDNLRGYFCEDGTPTGNSRFFTATMMFPAPAYPVSACENVVFKWNPDTGNIVQTGWLADLRPNSAWNTGNDVLGDGDCSMIYDRVDGPAGPNGTPIPESRIVFTNQSDWGVSGFTGNIGAYYATVTAGEDIRYGVHVFQNPTLIPFNLLAAGNSSSQCYPGDLKVINGVQTATLTEGFTANTTLYTSAWTFSSANLTTANITLLGRNTALSSNDGEGPFLTKLGNTWFIVQPQSGNSTAGKAVVLNLDSTLTTNATWYAGYPAQANFLGFDDLEPVQRQNTTTEYLLTNDGLFWNGQSASQGADIEIWESSYVMPADQFYEIVLPLLTAP